MKFEIDSKDIDEELEFPKDIPEGIKVALTQFMHN